MAVYRPTAGQIVILSIVLVAGGLLIFAPGLVKKYFRSAQGFNVAKSPEECIDYFRKAIEKRKYDIAAELYVTGDYKEQLKRAAVAAKTLGDAIDNLRYNMESRGYDSEKVNILLAQLEPFPRELTTERWVKSEREATVNLVETTGFDLGKIRSMYEIKLGKDAPLMRALTPVPGGLVAFKGQKLVIPVRMVLVNEKVYDKNEECWKLEITVTQAMRNAVDVLMNRYKGYTKVLESVSDDLRGRTFTLDALESQLKSDLEAEANR